MKRKVISILFALVLACSLSLVTAVPVAASPGTLEVNGPAVQLATGALNLGSFSPDGSKIVHGGAGAIWVMNADGSGGTQVGSVSGSRPKWAPDGRISYASGNDLKICNTDGSGEEIVVTVVDWSRNGATTSGVHSHDWIEIDGTYKLAIASSTGCSTIYAADVNFASLPLSEGDFTRITDGSTPAYAPAWSPDGTEIACAWGISSNMFVGVFKADGSGLDRTIGIGGSYGGDYPDWGANDKIAYHDGAKALHVMNADGSGDTVVFAGLAAMVAWSPDAKRIAYVDATSGLFGNVWTRSCPYGTIQDAIDAANPGDTINVATGIYDENIVIPNTMAGAGLQLLGAGKTSSIISITSGTAIMVGTSTNNPVMPVTIQGFGFNGNNDNRAIEIRASGNSENLSAIADNSFENFRFAIKTADIGCSYWNIKDNDFDGNRLPMYITGSYHEISGNVFANYKEAVSGDWDWAAADHLTIEDNEFLGGIHVMGADLSPADVLIQAAILFSSYSHDVSVTRNEITNSTIGVLVKHTIPDEAADLSNVTVKFNNITGNTNGVLVEGTPDAVLDAEYNWWDAANGPSGQGTGIGDTVSTNVEYSPWLPDTWQTYYTEAGVEIDTDLDTFSDLEEYWLGTDSEDDTDFPGAAVAEVANVHVPPGQAKKTETNNASVEAKASETESASVNLIEYGDNPVEDESVFGAVGEYIDVHCDDPENLEEVIIKVNYDDAGMTDAEELGLRMSYWNSDVGDWRQCSDQSVNVADNYIQATITASTTPALSYLLGGPFGGGPASVELDSEWYKTGDPVEVTIEDATESGIIAAFAWSDTVHEAGKITFALSETTETGIFEGSFDLVDTTPGAGELLVNDGDNITVAYLAVGYIAWVDNTPPEINNLTPADASNTTENKPTISATYTDDASGADNATAVMKVDGLAVAATATTSSITYTPADNLTDKSYAVIVDVFDLAGNPAEQASWSFTVDTIAPVIADLTPEDVGFVDTPTPTISATFTEDGSSINATSIVMTLDGNSVTPDTANVTGVSYTPTDNLTDASYTVTVDVSDLATNPATQASWSFTVDTTDPVIAIDAVTSPTYLPTQTITGTFTEANLDTINVDGVLATIDGGTWTAANVTLSVGTNLITATAMDKAGNTGVDSTSIEYAPLAVATVTVTSFVDEILANGVSTTGITVLVEDEAGIPISEMTVTLETTAGTIYPTSDVTDSEGKVTAELTSSVVVTTANVTATCDEVTGSAEVSFIADTCGMPDLVVGWNLTSLPLIPVGPSIDAVLDDLDVTDQVYVVWSYDAANDTWYFYEPATGVGDLDYMVDGKGYWVKMLEPATGLTVSGFEMPAPGETPPQYAVAEGWNLIGFKSTAGIEASIYLGSIYFTSIYGYDTGGYFSVDGSVDGDDLIVGYGYWVYVTASGYIAP